MPTTTAALPNTEAATTIATTALEVTTLRQIIHATFPTVRTSAPVVRRQLSPLRTI